MNTRIDTLLARLVAVLLLLGSLASPLFPFVQRLTHKCSESGAAKG